MKKNDSRQLRERHARTSFSAGDGRLGWRRGDSPGVSFLYLRMVTAPPALPGVSEWTHPQRCGSADARDYACPRRVPSGAVTEYGIRHPSKRGPIDNQRKFAAQLQRSQPDNRGYELVRQANAETRSGNFVACKSLRGLPPGTLQNQPRESRQFSQPDDVVTQF